MGGNRQGVLEPVGANAGAIMLVEYCENYRLSPQIMQINMDEVVTTSME